MPDLSFRSVTSGGDTSFSTNTIIAGVPAGEVENDLDTILFGASAVAPTAAPTHTTPAGYGLLGTFTYTASGGVLNSRISVFQRLAPASPASASLVASANSALAFLRLSHDNPDITGAFGQISFGAWSGTTPTASSITTARARSLLLMFVTQGAAQGCTPPSGMTERVDNATYALSGHDVIQVSAGASGAKAATVPSSTDGAWAFLELYSDPTVTPNISGVSDATPAHGASLTVTGTNFGATQGTKQLRIGDAVQPITSWADGTIVVSAVGRDVNRYGVSLDVEIWDGGVPVSNSFALTSITPPSDWAYVNLGTPNTTASFRITSIADLASGDQLAYETVGGEVTVFDDATFSAGSTVVDFEVETWTPTDGWGSAATQTLFAAEVPRMRTPYERLPRGSDDVWNQPQASVVLQNDVFGATSSSFPASITTSINTAIQAPRSTSFSLALAIQQANSAAVSINTAIAIHNTATSSIQIALQQAKTATASLNTAIRQGRSASVIQDLAIQLARNATHLIDLAVRQNRTASTSINTVIQRALNAVASIDTVVQLHLSLSTQISLMVQAVTSATFSINLQIQVPSTLSVSINAAILQAKTATPQIDAAVQTPRSSTASINAVVRTANNLNISVNTGILINRNASTSVQTVVQQARTATASLEAAIRANRSTSANIEAAIRAARTTTALLNAAVQQRNTSSITIDTAVQRALNALASINTVIAVSQTLTTQISLLVQAATNASFSINMQIQIPNSVSAALNLAILQSKSAAIPFDVAIQLAKTAQASINTAVSQNRSALTSINVPIRVSHTLQTSIDTATQISRNAQTAINTAVALLRTAAVNLNMQIQAGFTQSSLIDLAISQAYSAITSFNAAIQINRQATTVLDLVVALHNQVIFDIDMLVLARRSVLASLSLYVDDGSTIVPSPVRTFTAVQGNRTTARDSQGRFVKAAYGRTYIKPSR